jgi:hypothetical protein
MMTPLARLLTTLALAAPAPPPAVPPQLVVSKPAVVQKLWERIKDIGPLKAQLAAVRDKAVRAHICDGLVDLRALAASGGPLAGLAFRDGYRDRGWARPTLARAILLARARLRRELPGRDVTVGDVTQPGCGQLDHGVVIRHLQGPQAEAWLAAARPWRGVLASVRLARAADFPRESARFEDPNLRLRIVSEARGVLRRAGEPTLVRIAETRFREGGDDSGAAELEASFARIVRKKHLIGHVIAADASGPVGLWHFIDPERGQQLEVMTRAPATRGRGQPPLPKLADALEVRQARWQDRKPGSFPGEVHWIRQSAGWQAWSQVPEAGHISHLGGLDADLSYVTRDNQRHFAVDLAAMDVPATWRWFELLAEVARELGAPLESILVDQVVLDHLRANLPMKGRGSMQRHPLWRLISVSPGHDGHHHVRIAEPAARADQLARESLVGR